MLKALVVFCVAHEFLFTGQYSSQMSNYQEKATFYRGVREALEKMLGLFLSKSNHSPPSRVGLICFNEMLTVDFKPFLKDTLKHVSGRF